MKQRLLLLLSFFLFSFSLYAQFEATDENIESRISKNMALQVLHYPQEKIYIQTDRPYYVNGEKIFFRAFLFHASVNRPLYLSRYIYVELIDAFNKVVVRQKIRIEKSNTFYGYLSLPEGLPEGYYKLRSYTRYMENMGEEWFFARPVYVADPNSIKIEMETDVEFLSNKEVRVGIRFKDYKTKIMARPAKVNLKQEGKEKIHELTEANSEGWFYQKFDLRDSDSKRALLIEYKDATNSFSKYIRLPYRNNNPEVNFYPEGGYIVAGYKNRIAFKALSTDGKAVDIKGTVYNSKEELQAEFSTLHDGMGDFFLIPEEGETYYAEYFYNGQSLKVALPEIKTGLFTMQANWEADSLSVMINKPEHIAYFRTKRND